MFKRIFQCFESGMMYSGCGSGSRYDILELRIWIPILPMLFKHIWTILKTEESANYLPFSISHWKKFTGINLEIQFKFICSSFLPEPDLKQMIPDSLTIVPLFFVAGFTPVGANTPRSRLGRSFRFARRKASLNEIHHDSMRLDSLRLYDVKFTTTLWCEIHLDSMR